MIDFDEARLGPQLTATLRQDIAAFETLDFDPTSAPEVTRLMERLFGGTRGVDLRAFFEKRIELVGVETDPEQIMEPGRRLDDNDSNFAANSAPAYLTYFYHHDVLGDATAKPDEALFNERQVTFDRPGFGFMTVGGAYLAPGTSRIERLDTLLHEARHSDCAQLPSAADLAHYDKAEYLQMSKAARACFHVHMPCPAGHALEGELACDGHEGGAYTVGYAFSMAIYQSCVSCDETEKQEALASATENLTRLLR